MPVHIQPIYAGALNGSQGYSDLNIRFYTRTGTFQTMNGPVSGCTPLTASGGGEGGTSTLKNPTYTYDTTGSYTVSLRATNAQGNNTTTRTITIDVQSGNDGLSTVLQAETLTIIGSDYPSDPSAMHVKDVSPGSTGAGAIGYWDINGEALQWTYDAPTTGTYTISARYHSAVGAERVFKVGGSTEGTIVFPTNALSWDDGTWTQSAPLSFTLTAGTHTMQLLHDGTDDTWGLDLDSITITAPDVGGGGGGDGTGPIYQAEDATITGSAYPGDPYAAHFVGGGPDDGPGYTGSGYLGYWGLPGENLVFTLSGQTAGQADVVFRYQKGDVDDPTPRQLYVNGVLVTTINFARTGPEWDLGAWVDSNPLTVTLAAGTNTIELRHTGASYLYVDIDRMVVTPQAPATPPPVANFSRSPSGSQLAGTTINFTDTSTGTPTSWNWTFGDGGTSTSQNPSRTYSTPGVYTVTLQAINAGGQSTQTAVITITAAPVPPVAAFNASATTVVTGQVVTFTDQSTGSPTSWDWDFGDAATATTQNASHSYAAPGTYSVVLEVTNLDGTDDVTRQIVVVAPPVLDPGDPEPINRHEFTVLAKRQLSLAEENDLRRMLNVLKPASARMNVGLFGATMQDEVPIMRVAADSEWWEVVGSVVTRPGTEWAYADPGDVNEPKEQPRPPFSAYQGEQWSYTSDVANVLAYAENNGTLIRDYFQRVQFADGSHFDYRPELGARWPQDAITERLATDGAIVSHPLAIEASSGKHRWIDRVREVQSRTDRSRSGINPLYFNGISIEDLSLRSDSIFSPHRRQAGVPQRFWVTPEHHKYNPIVESIEMRMRTSMRVNRVQFQLAHFPHRAWVEAWDEANSAWQEVWSTTVVDSVPTNLVTRVDHHHHRHPQHSMAGHWMVFDLEIAPVVSQRFRIRMQRLATGMAPLDSKGQETSYSLGVRGFDLGYTIRSRDDIPRLALGDAIGNSVDPLGSRVIYTVRERAARLAVDGDSETAWLSEPQPMGHAVVNFYADVRTASGEGRLVDRWYLDPIKPGPMVNLYYSNDLPPSFLVADDTPLGLNEVSAEGLFVPTDDGISFDNSDPAYFLVPNGLIQFDYRKNWWVGVELEPRFAGPIADSAIFSFDDFTVQFATNSVVMGIPSGNDVVLPLNWNTGQLIRLVVSYDSVTNTMTMAARVGSADTVSVSVVMTHTMVGYAQHFRIAADPSLSLRSNYVLRRFVLNQSDNVDIDDFMADPSSWILKSTYAANDTGKTNGALLRLHPDFVNGEDFPFGLVGGPGDGFAAMNWTPIPRDFRLQKGWLDLPPTKARWWKFEFSNLVMEPIEVQTPLRRMVKVFPVSAQPEARASREDPAVDIPGYDVFSQGWQMYGDAPAPTPEPDPTKTMPTSLLYALDPSGVQRLRTASWAHGFMPWHVGSSFPRFRYEGQHAYDVLSYEHREKVGFFVGLKEIKAALTSYRGVDNTYVIIERFNDNTRLTTNQWTLTQGNAWSGPSLAEPLVIESMVYPSRNRISGLHFATQQTDAVQLVPDDNFRDPSLFDYDWTNTQRWVKGR
jgi:PKD repeat protein